MNLPDFIELETSRYCNRRCAWCPNGVSKERTVQNLMPWPLFSSIIGQLKAVGFSGWLALHNYNEPLANPRLLEELKLIAQGLPACKPSIFTNGDMLSVKTFVSLKEAGVRYLRVTRYPSHSRYANGPSEVAIKKWLRQSALDAMVTWAFGQLRQGFGASGVAGRMAIEIISPNIRTYNFRGGTTAVPLAKQRTTPCFFTTRSAAIDYKGQLKMCCNVYPEDAKHSDYVVGSLEDLPFMELWMSDKMRSYRNAHLRSDWSGSPICSQCSHYLDAHGGVLPARASRG